MEGNTRIAHRGFSEKYPENTMSAFREALSAGAQMIELDVQLTSDDYVVVIHDDRVDRTSNGRGRVRDFTWAELSLLDVSMGMTTGPEAIPLLSQVLEELSAELEINIELKNLPWPYEGLASKTLDIITSMNCNDSCIISSFDHYLLEECREKEPAIRRGLLYDSRPILFFEEIERVKPFSLHPGIDTFHPHDTEQAAKRGFRIYPWVAKDLETFQELSQLDYIHGLMVNDCHFWSIK